MSVILKEKLDQLLLSNWADFLNKSELIRITLQKARDNKYKVCMTCKPINQQMRISVTKFCLQTNEMWIEFSIPKDEDGVLIGTHIANFSYDGEVNIKESMGTVLKPHPKNE